MNQHAHVDRVASQPRHVDAEHDANLLVLNHPQQRLEVVTRHRLAGRLALIGFEGPDLFGRPAELLGPLGESLLQAITFAIILDLAETALANLHARQTLQVLGFDFMRHRGPRCWLVLS